MALLIEVDNLSVGWARAAMAVANAGELGPLLLQVNLPTSGLVPEMPHVRSALDDFLVGTRTSPCHTVANTIFPVSLWNPRAPASQLFERYLHAWPRIKRARGNHNGVYFHRLIAFPNPAGEPINQLQHVIDTYHGGNHRRSALAASIFNPATDHTDQRQRGFPCLDHVLFTPKADGLEITGYYATQDLIRKAYGNYLGLARLGQFMATYMGLRLAKMICITSIAMHDQKKKKVLPPLIQRLGGLGFAAAG